MIILQNLSICSISAISDCLDNKIPLSSFISNHHCGAHILENVIKKLKPISNNSEGEGEVKVKLRFSVPSTRDRRNRAELIESATPCHDAQVMGPFRVSDQTYDDESLLSLQ